MDFRAFDREYLQLLREGDPEVEKHFAAYFGELIYLKLRRRVHSRQLLEDIRQETLCRVLRAVREKDSIENPRKFGAFVSGVCHYVAIELGRNERRYEPAEVDAREPFDIGQDLDAPLVHEQRKRLVRKVLSELDKRDRGLLRAIFLDEREPAEVCLQFRVDQDYLRVLIFRAKARFRAAYTRSPGAAA